MNPLSSRATCLAQMAHYEGGHGQDDAAQKVKGATNLEVRLGTARARVSSDLDAVRRRSLVRFRDDLAVALRDGWSGFAGTLIDAGQIPTPTLALDQQIAQKLHACTAPDQPDWINDRAHDLVDLQLAFDLCDGTLAQIRRAATRLFASRRLHAWPPQVTPRQGWDERYRQEAQGLDVAATLDEAINWTNNPIAAIDGIAAPRDS